MRTILAILTLLLPACGIVDSVSYGGATIKFTDGKSVRKLDKLEK